MNGVISFKDRYLYSECVDSGLTAGDVQRSTRSIKFSYRAGYCSDRPCMCKIYAECMSNRFYQLLISIGSDLKSDFPIKTKSFTWHVYTVVYQFRIGKVPKRD